MILLTHTKLRCKSETQTPTSNVPQLLHRRDFASSLPPQHSKCHKTLTPERWFAGKRGGSGAPHRSGPLPAPRWREFAVGERQPSMDACPRRRGAPLPPLFPAKPHRTRFSSWNNHSNWSEFVHAQSKIPNFLFSTGMCLSTKNK